MKLFEINPKSFSDVDWSRHPHGAEEHDPYDYFFGGWIDSATGKFVNVFTEEGLHHHIEYIIQHPQEFDVNPKEIPDWLRYGQPADVPTKMWGQFEKIINKVVAKGRWVRLFVGTGKREGRELNFEGTTKSIEALAEKGVLGQMTRRFNPAFLVVDLKDKKKSKTFPLHDQKGMGEFRRWIGESLLREFSMFDPHDVFDPLYMRDEEDAQQEGKDKVKREKITDRPKTPAKDSNISKAKRIRTLAKMKAKEANPGDSDTVSGWRSDPHQGGHSSAFLNRGSHG